MCVLCVCCVLCVRSQVGLFLIFFSSFRLALSCIVCYHCNRRKRVKMSSIYFGGSRHFSPCEESIAVLRAVVLSGQSVHVGCQKGADQSVVSYVGFFSPSSLVVFAVAPSCATAPLWVRQAPQKQVRYSAGGSSAPMPARYLLRSIAAFQGCSSAVFFAPGPGSLAVARECVGSGLPVFAFAASAPAPVPSCAGQWVASSFQGFACWSWQSAQLSFI